MSTEHGLIFQGWGVRAILEDFWESDPLVWAVSFERIEHGNLPD